MFMEIGMGRNDNVRKAIGLLAQAVISAKGRDYTGQVVIRLHVHKGAVGKATAQTEEVIDTE